MSSKQQSRRRAAPRVPISTMLLLVLVLTLALILGVLLLYFSLTGRTPEWDFLNFFHSEEPAVMAVEEEPETEPTVPLTMVVVPNNIQSSVMCRDSYTISAEAAADAAGRIAATAGNEKLTNAELQIYYISAVNAYRAGNHADAPDFSLPLEKQPCPLGDGTLSWQHYFLQQAISGWQAQRALLKAAAEPQLITEAAFKPNETDDLHGKYVASDLPVNNFLYADKPHFIPNKLHQAYLDGLEVQLEQLALDAGYADLSSMAAAVFGTGVTAADLVQAAVDYNTAYMYFTERSYEVTVHDDDAESYLSSHSELAGGGVPTVTIRQVLLIPDKATIEDGGKVSASKDQWSKCQTAAEQMLQSYRWNFLTNQNAEVNFARLANQESQDVGSRLNGGLYRNIPQGDLIAPVDEWCFASGRKVGDIGIIRSEVGIHIVYLVGFGNTAEDAAREALRLEQEQTQMEAYLAKVSLKPDYSAVALWADASAEGFSLEAVLYPDVGHERFPEAITYFQQDYMYHPYGGSYVGRGGCGITTMAMLATYMTDQIYTPAMLATRYPNYHDASGTNGDIFRYVPAELGFHIEKQANKIDDVIEALKKGQRVISLQQLGHFTSGGHYLLLQRYYADNDTFQVRDSNIYNYGKLSGHKVDYFTRADILSGSTGFYIMQPKIVRIPACARCGGTFDEHGPELLLSDDYLCEKCELAISRRTNFLTILSGC